MRIRSESNEISLHSGFLAEEFQPTWWLRNPHAQTILCTLLNPKVEISYQRQRLETPDQDFLDLDWIFSSDAHAPIVLALHGLEGSSRSGYMHRLMNAVQDLGWSGVVMNFRGCSGEPNRLLRSYHSGETGDLNWVVEWIVENYPDRSLYLTGFSLGGNVLAKWLGEGRSEIPRQVKGACVCSVPYDLLLCQRNLDQGFNLVYVWRFLRSLKRKALEKSKRNPGTFDAGRVKKSLTLREFDDAFTAPIHGFKDYVDYYTRSSSKSLLKSIQVPTMLLQALDDPLIPFAALPTPQEVNQDKVLLHFLKNGGHVGFYDIRRQSAWMEYQILSWFQYLHQIILKLRGRFQNRPLRHNPH